MLDASVSATVLAKPRGSGDDALVLAAHRGPLEQPRWRTFLETLKDRIGADYVSLAFRRSDAAIGDTSVMSAGAEGPRLQDARLATMFNRGPSPYENLEPGRVYDLDELLKSGAPGHAAFRHEFLGSRGYRFLRVVRIVEPSGSNAWLGVLRRADDFAPEARGLLQQLATHLSVAVQTLAALEHERMHADIAAYAVRRLNFGWLTLDARGRVIEIDGEAGRMLSGAAVGALEPGRALGASPSARRSIHQALGEFRTDPAARPRAIHLTDEPWLDLLMAPLRSRTVSGATTPVAVAYVHGEQMNGEERCEQLTSLFGLSRSEARVALALSRGRTIAEAASEIGLTLETARNYTKRIYAKTATRNQADLVRLILASIVSLV